LAGFALFVILLTLKMNVGRRLSTIGRQQEERPDQ